MVDFDYLVKGLAALARAHRVSPMAGHLGAALVAGYFIGEQNPDLDDRVYRGIEGELDRILRGESVFGPGPKSPITTAELFEPVPNETSRENLIDGVAEALARTIDQPRESGHNVIFAAIAIRALKDHPEFATPFLTGGLRELMAGFNTASPGSGYYGKDRGRINGRNVTLTDADDFPPYADLPAMAATVLEELIQHAGERRDGYGGLWHVINHGAALAELDLYGYRDLARRGLAAHHKHLRLFRTVPNVADELGADTPTAHDPRTAAYWQMDTLRRDRALLDHRIKTLYGYDALARLVADADEKKQANDRLRYLM